MPASTLRESRKFRRPSLILRMLLSVPRRILQSGNVASRVFVRWHGPYNFCICGCFGAGTDGPKERIHPSRRTPESSESGLSEESGARASCVLISRVNSPFAHCLFTELCISRGHLRKHKRQNHVRLRYCRHVSPNSAPSFSSSTRRQNAMFQIPTIPMMKLTSAP
jgi:hypothetical protein